MNSLSFFSFLHIYGFLVGLGIWATVFLTEKIITTSTKIPTSVFWQATSWVMAGGIIGARLHHVLTDFYLYQQHPLDILKIWQGGLSIIGAVVGGGAMLWVYLYFTHARKSLFWIFADAVVFGLPFGQAIGRLGNYFNQELYGLPTHLPWGIFIDRNNRFPLFRDQEKYHPLFLYEIFFLLFFGFLIWFYKQKKSAHFTSIIGKGNLFLGYVLYYSVIRFGLDFLRIDKSVFMFYSLQLGVNQILLGIVAIMCSGVLFLQWKNHDKIEKI
jgi:phosphatidylglycerol---prolipoprotein diacylglyceryl transferase